MASRQQAASASSSGAWTEPTTWGARKQGIAFAAGLAVLCVGGFLTAKHARGLNKKQRSARKARGKALPAAPASSKAAKKPSPAAPAASSGSTVAVQAKSQELVTPGEPPALVAAPSARGPEPSASKPADAPAAPAGPSSSATVPATASSESAPSVGAASGNASAAPAAAAAAAPSEPSVAPLPEWEVLKNRGNEFYKVTMLKEAKEMYDRAIQLKPDFIPGIFNRSTLYFHHKDYNAALADLDRILQIDNGHAKAWYTRGRVLQVLGEFTKAMECFEKAVELGDPKTAHSSRVAREQLREAMAKKAAADAEEAARAAAAEAEVAAAAAAVGAPADPVVVEEPEEAAVDSPVPIVEDSAVVDDAPEVAPKANGVPAVVAPDADQVA